VARNRSNLKVVPECKAALDQMKYEIAAELGLMSASTGDIHSEFAGELGGSSQSNGVVHWDTLATRDAGAVGGAITRRLIQQAEQVLKGL
jgi:hypothetical protein